MPEQFSVLEQVKVEEVSFVDRPANAEARVLLYKSEDGQPMEDAVSDEPVAKAKDEDTDEEVSEETENVEKVGTMMPPGLAKPKAGPPAAGPPDEGGGEDDVAALKREIARLKRELAAAKGGGGGGGAPFPPMSKLDKAMEELPPEVSELLKAQRDELDEVRKRQEAREATIRKQELTAKADGLQGLVGSQDEIVDALTVLDQRLEPADFEKVESLLRKTSDAIEDSVLLKEFGTSSPRAGSPEAELEAIKKSLMETDPKLTAEMAEVRALDENPSLYEKIS